MEFISKPQHHMRLLLFPPLLPLGSISPHWLLLMMEHSQVKPCYDMQQEMAGSLAASLVYRRCEYELNVGQWIKFSITLDGHPDLC